MAKRRCPPPPTRLFSPLILVTLLLFPTLCHADYILSSYYLNNPTCSGGQLFQSASTGDLGYGSCRRSTGSSFFFSLRCINASAYAQDIFMSAGCIGSPFYSSIGVFPSSCEAQTGGNSIISTCVLGTYSPPPNALLKLSWSDAATTCSSLSTSFVSPDGIQVSQVDTCSSQGSYSGKESCNSTHSFAKVWMSSTTCDSAVAFQISNEKSLGCSMQMQGSSGPPKAEVVICNITSSGASSPSSTPAPSPTETPTVSPTIGASASETPSNTPTCSVTPSASATIGASASETPSNTPTSSVTPSASATIGASASETPSNTPTCSVTQSETPSPSPTYSLTPNASTSVSASPLMTAASDTPSPSPTTSESPTSSPSSSPTVSPTVSLTASVSASPTASLAASVSSSIVPTSTSTFKASPTPNTVSAGYSAIASCSSSFFSLQKDVTHIFACYTNGTRDDAIMSILIYNPDAVKMTIAQRRSKISVSSTSLLTVLGANSSFTADLSSTTDAMGGTSGLPTESSEVWQRREIKCYNAENNANGHCVLNVLSVSTSAVVWLTVYGKEPLGPDPPPQTSPSSGADPFDANERMVVYIMAGLLSILGTAALCHACGFYELPCLNPCCNRKNKGLTSKRPVFSSVYGANDDPLDHADGGMGERDRSDSDFVGSFEDVAHNASADSAAVGGGRSRAHSGGTLTLPFGTTVSRVQTRNPLRVAV